MEVQAEIKELKKTLKDMDKRITQLTMVVQDIRNHLPPIQQDPQRPGKSPGMAAALARISELKEFHPMGFENIPGIEDLEMHQQDIKRDNLAKTTPSSTNNNSKNTTRTNRPKRNFHQFSTSLVPVYKSLLENNLLKPLEPQKPSKVLPSNHNPNAFYSYHQMPGHHTNNCIRLKHKIQDLIEDGTFPLSLKKPNIASSPMPKHKPNVQINQISLSPTSNNPSSSKFDPSLYIIPASEPEPIILMPEDLRICFLESTKAQKPRWAEVTENKKWAMDDVTLGIFSFDTTGGSSHSRGFLTQGI